MSSIHILPGQDKEDEVILTPEAFKETSAANNIFFDCDDEQAIPFLSKGGAFKKANVYDFILPDVYIPRPDRKVVSPHIKMLPRRKKIPLEMIFSSLSQRKVLETFRYHVNSYISKPVKLDKFFKEEKQLEIIRKLIVDLPKTNHHGA